MPLTVQISQTLYDGTYTLVADNQSVIDVGAEVNAVRAVTLNGYVNLSWSAGFLIDTSDQRRGYYEAREARSKLAVGWYEVRYGNYTMFSAPIESRFTGTPKITGVYGGNASPIPGDTWVVGSGATLTSVNIGSDRLYRGDRLVYYVEPFVTGTIYLAVNVGYVDNASNTNKYIIHP